jgi:hypothetical protein
MPDLYVTSHAIQRYQERVCLCSDDDARQALSGAVMVMAADFGAGVVRLGTGQRVLIRDHSVITILPSEAKPWAIWNGE